MKWLNIDPRYFVYVSFYRVIMAFLSPPSPIFPILPMENSVFYELHIPQPPARGLDFHITRQTAHWFSYFWWCPLTLAKCGHINRKNWGRYLGCVCDDVVLMGLRNFLQGVGGQRGPLSSCSKTYWSAPQCVSWHQRFNLSAHNMSICWGLL